MVYEHQNVWQSVIGIHSIELRCRLPNMAGYTVKRWIRSGTPDKRLPGGN
jgi:hypothetical protein